MTESAVAAGGMPVAGRLSTGMRACCRQFCGAVGGSRSGRRLSRAWRSLEEIDRPVDMVDVFRPREELFGIAEQAIAIDAKVLWGQIGVYDDEAAALAESAGLKVVMDRCPKIELFRPFWKPRLDLPI